MIESLIIILAIISGQLLKIPFLGSGGLSLLDISLIILCIFAIIRKKFLLEKPPLFIAAALIFTLISIFSLSLSPLHLTLPEYLISFFYSFRFFLYILFAWLIASKAFEKFQKLILRTLIFSGAGLAILGILQFIIFPDLNFLTSGGWDPHYYRTVSSFLDPNFAGAFFTLTLLLIINRQPTKYMILSFILVYLALLTTFSRSSYIMFLTSGLTLSYLLKSKSTAIKTLLLFLILILGFHIYIQLISKPKNIDRTQSASSRLNTWQQGWQLFNSHPLLGIGFNTYRFGLREYELGDVQFLQSHGATSNDSSLLFVASTTGTIGLFSFLFFLFSLIWKANNHILTAALIGLGLHSFFANSLFFPPILLWILLISSAPAE